MRILAVGAHPDDLEILCGGTLAKYAQAGHHVTMAVATNGELGSPTLSKPEIAEIRHQEACASAALIGADFIWINCPDGGLYSNEDTRLRFLNAVRKVRPDIILTHAPTDYHPDHRATGEITWGTRIFTIIPGMKTEEPHCLKIPDIYFFDTTGSVDFEPEYYVDISETFELKRQMLACHKSQLVWFENQYNISDYMDLLAYSSHRGKQCGVKHAECFRICRNWPDPAPVSWPFEPMNASLSKP